MIAQSWWTWLVRSSKVVTILGGAIVLLVAIAWLSGLFYSKVPPGHVGGGGPRLDAQTTDIVHEITQTYIEEAIGTLKASRRSIVSSKLLASIVAIHVTAGDRVSEGQLLVELDNREYRTRLDQSRQSLDSAVASRNLAEQNFERMEALLRQNAVSRAEFDQASRDLQVAKAEESRAREAITEAEVMLSYTSIVAPKAGRIVDRQAEPGNIAYPGAPLLVLYDASSLRLEAPVMEHLAVKLRVGQTLSVYVDALQQSFDATIDEIVPQADAPSRSFLVKVTLPHSEDLYEGMFGRLRIPSGERRHLCLNMDALLRIGQLEFVDVVHEDGTLERRLIKTGQVGMPGRQEVLSGLEAGERVVLQPQRIPSASNARDGSSIRSGDSNKRRDEHPKTGESSNVQ